MVFEFLPHFTPEHVSPQSLPTLEDHISYSYKELTQEVKAYIQQSIENNNNGTIIIQMVSSMFGINITISLTNLHGIYFNCIDVVEAWIIWT